ncbi:MAG: 2Fe-2S iron-sulfur cluster binding domain-containing protein [Planctomycetes bacterium]|nr:2Fe-2S iron-sulfur cluster binding domain-containing protein [Planctomycetota bacterium]
MTTVRLLVQGQDRDYALAVGQSVLEAAMAQGLDLDHACGGVCACSTCHVKILRGGDCFSAASDDELDQLDEARDVDLDSRLGCQARLERAPADGIVELRIPLWNVNAVREGGS